MGAPHIQNGMPEAEVIRLVSSAIDFELGQGEASGLTWAGRTEKLNQIGSAYGVPPIRAMERGGFVRAKLNAIMDALDVPDGASLYLDFLRGRYYGAALDFSRPTGGSYFDANRVLRWAAANELRYDHDPMTGAARGALVEEQQVNIVAGGSQPAGPNGSWTLTGVTATINGGPSPNGANNATRLTENTANSAHQISANINGQTATGRDFWNSVVVSRPPAGPSRRYAQVWCGGFAGHDIRTQCRIDLDTGEVYSITGVGEFAAFSVALGGGRYRVFLKGRANGTGTVQIVVSMLPSRDVPSASYTGDGESSVLVWEFNQTNGLYPGSIIPTTNAAVTRAADNLSIDDLSWLTGTGTFVVKTGGLRFYRDASNAANSRRHLFYLGGPNGNQLFVFWQPLADGGFALGFVHQMANGPILSSFLPSTTFVQPDMPVNVAFSLDGSVSRISVNGSPVVELAVGVDLAAMTTFMIGQSSTAGTRMLNGHMRALNFIPPIVSDAVLQGLAA